MKMLILSPAMLVTFACLTHAQPPSPSRASEMARMQRAARPILESHPTADSVYAVARRELNQARYDQAIPMFELVATRYPLALVAPNAWYWRAYALHRRAIERGSTEDLRDALDGLLVHRAFYPDAFTRGDVRELLGRIRDSLEVRQDSLSRAVLAYGSTGLYEFGCDRLRTGMQVTMAIDLRKPRSSDAVAEGFGRMVFGRGMCLDLSGTSRMYAGLDEGSEARAVMIAALGRSLHPSGTTELGEIAATEKDQSLRNLAIDWLRMRDDPKAVAILKTLPRR